MTDKVEKINFYEVQQLLHNIYPLQLRRLLKEYQLTGEKNGKYVLYNYADIIKLKLSMEENYRFNKQNRLIKSQTRDLGLKKQDYEKLTKIEPKPIDRIYEFQGSISFYDKDEVFLLVHERTEKQRLLNSEQIGKRLGVGYYQQVQAIIEHFNLIGKKIGNSQGLYYEPTEIARIKRIMDEQYQYNLKHRVRHSDILEMGGNPNDIAILTAIKTSPIERIGKFKNVGFLFDKEEALKRINGKLLTDETYTTDQVYTLLNLPDYYGKRYLSRLGIKSIKVFGELQNHWIKREIDELIKKRDEICEFYNKNYITLGEFEELTGISFTSIKRIHRNLGVPIEYHDIPQEIKFGKYAHVKSLIAKKDVKTLINNYIKAGRLSVLQKEKLYNILGALGAIINNQELNMNSIRAKTNPSIQNNKLTSLFEFSQYIASKNEEDLLKELNNYSLITNSYSEKTLVSQNDILNKYNVSYSCFVYIRDLNIGKLNFIIYKNLIYYAHKDIQALFYDLLNKQQKLVDDYFTREEAEKIGGTIHYLSKVQSIKIPRELRFGHLRKNELLYKKDELVKVLQEKEKRIIFKKYKDKIKDTTLPSEIFIEMIKELDQKLGKYHFKRGLEHTQSLWIKYVVKKVNSSDGNNKTLYTIIARFTNLTELLCKIVDDKEITEWSTNEINTKIFNLDVSPSYLQHIYIFLNEISYKYQVNFQMDKIIDIYKVIESTKKSRQVKSYTIEEFVMLIDYVSDIKLHKKEAIKEIRRPLTGNQKYKEYESVWLYILIHLNNAWRSTDIVEKIPRISLPANISTLKDFEKHELTEAEADIIVWELTAKVIGTQHNKNSKEAYFFFSEELKLPLANALVLSELKCQMERPSNHNLIKLTDEDVLNSTLNNRFFKHFEIDNFIFQSLAANRSYITFVNMVLKKKTNRNPLEVSKLLRNHSSYDVTDRYVQISDVHLNKIAKEVFNKGYFGYTFEYLLKSIFEIEIGVNVTEYTDTELIKQTFGDIYKIENFAIYINQLEKNNSSLYEYVSTLNQEKKIDLVNQISLEQLPAKQAFWQCIFGECIYRNRSCEACPFAIPHIYSLTKSLDNIENLLSQYEQEEIKGEKTRTVNLLYKNLMILSAAKKKFGEKVIEAFLGYKYSDLKKRISELENFYYYLTIERNQ